MLARDSWTPRPAVRCALQTPTFMHRIVFVGHVTPWIWQLLASEVLSGSKRMWDRIDALEGGRDAPHQCVTYPKPMFGDPQHMISFSRFSNGTHFLDMSHLGSGSCSVGIFWSCTARRRRASLAAKINRQQPPHQVCHIRNICSGTP